VPHGFHIPEHAPPGFLSLRHLRYGKPTCNHIDDSGQPVWLLTFMVPGAVREVLPATAQLLVLAGNQGKKLKNKK